MRILYIHGFGSSPASRKARFFSEKLAECGRELTVPDLAPDFAGLTISGQLKVMDEAIGGEEAVLIGSSLGGYLSAIYAGQHANVRRVLLLAPAFRFVRLWEERVGTERMAQWEREGTLPVYHYGADRELPLGFQLMTDARRYPDEPQFEQPGKIAHGIRDETVPILFSEEYVSRYPNVELVRYNSGHELTDVLEPLWLAFRDFLLSTETHI